MTADRFEQIATTLATAGPEASITALIADLAAERQYSGLFYAHLLAARHRLGINPNPTEPSGELPESAHDAYEIAIREAGRAAGTQALAYGDIAAAWPLFRMIGETAPVREALERLTLAEDDDADPYIDLALGQAVAPRWGFALLLERQGICSAITALHSYEAAFKSDVRRELAALLVDAMHAQVAERMRVEIGRREASLPETTVSLDELMAGRDWLTGEESYLVDPSHLSAAVQAAVSVSEPASLRRAKELCRYGQRLGERQRVAGDPPFDDLYTDMEACLGVLAGDDVEAGLERFRAKLNDDESAAPAAELLVQLLLHLNRLPDALAVARSHLIEVDERRLSCPGPLELARRVGDAAAFADVARRRGDAVHFLAGLLMGRK